MTHHLALDPGLRALGWGFLVLGWCSLLVRVVSLRGNADAAQRTRTRRPQAARDPGPAAAQAEFQAATGAET